MPPGLASIFMECVRQSFVTLTELNGLVALVKGAL